MLFLDHESDSCRWGFVLNLWSSDFILEVQWSKLLLAFKSQGTEKIDLFSKGAENCQNLTYESLIIVDPKSIEISSLILGIINWLSSVAME